MTTTTTTTTSSTTTPSTTTIQRTKPFFDLSYVRTLGGLLKLAELVCLRRKLSYQLSDFLTMGLFSSFWTSSLSYVPLPDQVPMSLMSVGSHSHRLQRLSSLWLCSWCICSTWSNWCPVCPGFCWYVPRNAAIDVITHPYTFFFRNSYTPQSGFCSTWSGVACWLSGHRLIYIAKHMALLL